MENAAGILIISIPEEGIRFSGLLLFGVDVNFHLELRRENTTNPTSLRFHLGLTRSADDQTTWSRKEFFFFENKRFDTSIDHKWRVEVERARGKTDSCFMGFPMHSRAHAVRVS